jgi:hypothetical protein
MKTVKLSITIPETLFAFVQKKAVERAQPRGQRPNVSGEFVELLLQERAKKREKQPA